MKPIITSVKPHELARTTPFLNHSEKKREKYDDEICLPQPLPKKTFSSAAFKSTAETNQQSLPNEEFRHILHKYFYDTPALEKNPKSLNWTIA